MGQHACIHSRGAGAPLGLRCGLWPVSWQRQQQFEPASRPRIAGCLLRMAYRQVTVVTHDPCGCIKTEKPGHIHTKLCIEHRNAVFGANISALIHAPTVAATLPPSTDNSDLIR